MTFRDLWVGGVLVKTGIIAFRSTFLKEKQFHYVIKFSFVFRLTDSSSQLNNHSTNMKIQNRIWLYTELKHEKITQWIPAIFLAVMNGDIKSCKSSSSLCVTTLYVHMSKCCFIKVKSKHEERLIFDRLFLSIPQAVKPSKILISLIA